MIQRHQLENINLQSKNADLSRRLEILKLKIMGLEKKALAKVQQLEADLASLQEQNAKTTQGVGNDSVRVKYLESELAELQEKTTKHEEAANSHMLVV